MKNKFSQVKAVQDESCHWYIIPNALCEEFYQDSLNEEFIDSGEFSKKWSRYLTGGDLNNIQLWIEVLPKSKYNWDEFPEWAKVAATDFNGNVCVSESMPKLSTKFNWWEQPYGERSLVIKNVGLTPDWKNSLEERPKK